MVAEMNTSKRPKAKRKPRTGPNKPRTDNPDSDLQFRRPAWRNALAVRLYRDYSITFGGLHCGKHLMPARIGALKWK